MVAPSGGDTPLPVPSYYRDPAAPDPNVLRRVGVTALIARDGRFLVERRADGPGVWAFVGGASEDEETVLEALAREVREETGFDVERAELVGLFSDPTRIIAYPDGNVCRVLSIAFLVTPGGDGEPALSLESAGMGFVSREQLAELDIWPAQRPIRDALLRYDGRPIVE